MRFPSIEPASEDWWQINVERLGYSRVSLFVISLERKLIYMLANYVGMQAHTCNLKLPLFVAGIKRVLCALSVLLLFL